MKDFISSQQLKIKKVIEGMGYKVDNVILNVSSRPDLGQFQYNGVMGIAKKNNLNPYDLALKVVERLSLDNDFINLNVARPAFINFSFTKEALINYMNLIHQNIEINFNRRSKKRILIDYGGANVAKRLHVGHLRSANIGEALKRLAIALNYDAIGDVHLGDWGRPMGLVMLEIKNRYPDLVYFKDSYQGEYPAISPVTNQDLDEIYPLASQKAKDDEHYLNEAKEITTKLQEGHPGYRALWQHIVKVSVADIKKIYDKLNTSFELWEGESDSHSYIEEMMMYLKEKGLVYESDGALVMDVAKESDLKPMPPLIFQTSHKAILYGTTELATLYSRVKRFDLDEIWYLTDKRQAFHFEQAFRAAYKSKIVPKDIKLSFMGFGTMNGKDGKPFKTRAGDVMPLEDLITLVKEETITRLNPNIKGKEREKIIDMITMAAIKYADLLPSRETDYIFDPAKFSDMTGKTGPYILYSTVRLKSLLKKAKEKDFASGSMTVIANDDDLALVLSLLSVGTVLNNALEAKSLNDITEYLYKLNSLYNHFYASNHILTESDNQKRSSWLTLSAIILETNLKLLHILAIEVPSRM